MTKPAITSILFVITIVAISYYLQQIESEYSKQIMTNSEQQYYSHKYTNFSLTNTDSSGKAETLIRSPQTNFSTAEQKTLMASPEMLLYRKNSSPISITAEYAEVIHTDNITSLNDNVVVSIANKNKRNVRMTTDQLFLDHTLQIGKTAHKATILHGKGIMHGVGLEFNPHTQQIKFLNKVRGTYEN